MRSNKNEPPTQAHKIIQMGKKKWPNNSLCIFMGSKMSTPKLTKEQAIILMGYTGIVLADFNDFHKDVEQRLGRPVFNVAFGSEEFMKKLKPYYEADFFAILPEGMRE